MTTVLVRRPAVMVRECRGRNPCESHRRNSDENSALESHDFTSPHPPSSTSDSGQCPQGYGSSLSTTQALVNPGAADPVSKLVKVIEAIGSKKGRAASSSGGGLIQVASAG